METDMLVTILGARGTAPTVGPQVAGYGGGTSCVLVRMGGQTMILDAGSGIMAISRHLKEEEHSISLLLSHPHFDHLVGIPSCPVLYDPTRTVQIFAAPHGGLSPRQQVERLMSPPLWPVGPEAFQAQVSFHDLGNVLMLGNVRVTTMEGAHPGGCTVFRLEYGERSVVYATDYELDEQSFPRLAAFAQGCTLLLCDGQYSDTELARHRGYGHSSWREAARLGRECAAERLLIIHHAPWRSDAELDAAQPLLRNLFQNAAFARDEEMIPI
ncbi:MAG: MBL fold metallo-hydrolase [Angelakisella sp.]